MNVPKESERNRQTHAPEPMSVFSPPVALCDGYRTTVRRDLRNADAPGNDERPGITWRKPAITETCVGLEINAYLPAEL